MRCCSYYQGKWCESMEAGRVQMTTAKQMLFVLTEKCHRLHIMHFDSSFNQTHSAACSHGMISFYVLYNHYADCNGAEDGCLHTMWTYCLLNPVLELSRFPALIARSRAACFSDPRAETDEQGGFSLCSRLHDSRLLLPTFIMSEMPI